MLVTATWTQEDQFASSMVMALGNGRTVRGKR